MTEFIPSPDFIKKTMSKIQKADEKSFRIFKNQTVHLLVTYAGGAVVIFAGIANLIRIMATVFVPVTCH